MAGGGIFGVATAVTLATAGASVDLFELRDDLVCGASGVNQLRLHRGYHYPRSPSTVQALATANDSFQRLFDPIVISDHVRFYTVAKRGSRTSGTTYIDRCADFNLDFEIDMPEVIRSEAVDVCIKVQEAAIDPMQLRSHCWNLLRANGVRVHLRQPYCPRMSADFDAVLLACYAKTNDLLPVTAAPINYQFKVCELPLLLLPEEYRNLSVVVMDGRFPSLDPFGSTGLHVLGHVDLMHHASNIGTRARIPEDIIPLLDGRLHPPLPSTRVPQMMSAAGEYLKGIDEARHIGSWFTVRTHLAGREATDDRPTLIQSSGSTVISVFSGKIATCVDAADYVAVMLGLKG